MGLPASLDPGPSRLRGCVKMVKSGRLGAPVCEAHGHEAAGRVRLRAAQGGTGRLPPLAGGGAWASAQRPRADLVERRPVTSPRRDAYAVGKL